MAKASRLTEFADALVGGIQEEVDGIVYAWVVLPNHWHLLGQVDLAAFRPWIARLHNGKSTQWNREDATPGRKVWYRFSDRRMRSERHYYVALNYIHGNPVKHLHVTDARHWPWSSLHDYLAAVGREKLVEWWRAYPVLDFGMGWDD